MTHDELRLMAESYQAGELPVDTSHQISAHLEECAACRTELAARAALRQTLRRAFRQAPELAPSEQFSTQLRATIHRSPVVARPFHSAPRWLALAAGLVLVAVLAWQYVPSRTPAHAHTLAADAAGDHQNCAVAPALDEPPISLDEAARRYGSAYGSLRSVVEQTPVVQQREVEIVAAHWCVFNGRRFAHIVVRRRDQVASILLTPVEGGTDAVAAPVSCPATGRFQVACFDLTGHAGFVVSGLTAEDNLNLAQAVAPALQTFFTRA
ncbi:MAG TPA: zf-HC2 domain-containing protein [Vicinamibacterales bacterium]|nr:zf-HC2 domain-containing protein [Vicinamibacterales bacterium]